MNLEKEKCATFPIHWTIWVSLCQSVLGSRAEIDLIMEQPPTAPELGQEVAQNPTMSLPARLLNVFAVPGEVFAEVKATPISTSNWLVPTLCSAIIGVIAAFIIFSQPAVIQQLREQQAKVMDQQVKAGKMTQAQADQALALMEKVTGPTLMKVIGGVGAVVASFVHAVWWGFILWLLSRWLLRVQIKYAKALEVVGLAMMIGVLGAIVGMLLIVNVGRLGATPSLALMVNDFDATRKSHLFMGAANVFYFWQVGVTAVGLSKLTQVPFVRALWVLLAFWLLQESFFILVGMGQFAL